VTAKFMEAVKNRTSYDLVDPTNGKVVGQLDATEVWDR
jgi:ribonucleoside-diphosphate reductase alpha chain